MKKVFTISQSYYLIQLMNQFRSGSPLFFCCVVIGAQMLKFKPAKLIFCWTSFVFSTTFPLKWPLLSPSLSLLSVHSLILMTFVRISPLFLDCYGVLCLPLSLTSSCSPLSPSFSHLPSPLLRSLSGSLHLSCSQLEPRRFQNQPLLLLRFTLAPFEFLHCSVCVSV